MRKNLNTRTTRVENYRRAPSSFQGLSSVIAARLRGAWQAAHAAAVAHDISCGIQRPPHIQ